MQDPIQGARLVRNDAYSSRGIGYNETVSSAALHDIDQEQGYSQSRLSGGSKSGRNARER